MRPILVELGPWQPWHIAVLFVVLIGASLVWRRLEARVLGEETEPRPILWPLTLIGSAAGAVAVFLLVNHFAPVSIKSYGVMLLIAFSAGIWWLGRSGSRDGITLADTIDIGLISLVCAVIGARVLFVILEWSSYAQNPKTVLNVWEGGLSFHGGLLGAVLGCIGYCAVKRRSFWQLGDLMAAPAALGYAFARIGCFLNGCCHGAPTDLPWGVIFPANTRPGEVPLKVQPTQIYSSLTSLAIFAILVRMRDRYPRRGYLMGAYLVVYSFARFLMEYSRRNASAELAMTNVPDMHHHAISAALFLLTAAFAVLVLALPRLASPEGVLAPARWAAVWLGLVIVAGVAVAVGAGLGDSPAVGWMSPLTKGQVGSFAIGAGVFALVLATWPRALPAPTPDKKAAKPAKR